jgi:hypothetical protein
MYNVVNNPIPRSGLFTTLTLEEIQTFISGMPRKEQANAHLVLMLTLNACNKLVEDNILSKEVFCG